MKKYWFYLFPDTFVWTKDRIGLVYNTNNGAYYRFDYTEPGKTIVDELNNIDSLYRITLTDDDMAKPAIKSFVEGVIEIAAGEITVNSPDTKRPISFKPELRVRDDAGFYKWRHNNGIAGNVIDNLNGLIFYINGSEHGSDEYYKQTIFPLENSGIIDRNKIIDFASKCRKSPHLSNILLVGNIWEYPNHTHLLSGLTDMVYSITIYCLISDLLFDRNRIDQLEDKYESVSFSILIDDCNVIHEFFKNRGMESEDRVNKRRYVFFCKNELEYENATELIQEYDLDTVEVIPLYTGDNIDFFQNYIYITEEEILNSKLSKREVFAHQGLNTHFFGKLYIMPDENIYANCNNPAIGTINDSPYEVVYKEIQEGKSWLLTRNTRPCCECIYRWLCPSLSNYELVIGRPDLCMLDSF
jgi:pseudo-rSAM protein